MSDYEGWTVEESTQDAPASWRISIRLSDELVRKLVDGGRFWIWASADGRINVIPPKESP